MKKLLILGLILFCQTSFAWGFGHTLVEQRPDVQQFIQYMAQEYQFDPDQLADMFNTIQTVPASQLAFNKRPAIQQIKNRHDFVPWYQYRNQFLTEQEIADGTQYWQKNHAWLHKAQDKYGIPPSIIIATIGIETKYGQRMGQFPVFKTLAVLAFDYSPRKDYFTRELVAYLLYCRSNNLDALNIMGSYTGAIGQPQFMPSNISQYGVDFDHKGHVDLISHDADAIGSVANFYAEHHWQIDQPVAFPAEIKNLQAFRFLQEKHEKKMTITEFAKYGIYPVGHVKGSTMATLIKLDSQTEQPEYWLTFNNFKVLKNYNNSTDYAMALFQLSQEIGTRYAQTNNQLRISRHSVTT